MRNARVNNLKGISLDIPRDKFIVVAGVSGSGKSSLAFDTLYAEGQRRYVESLSSYARQFLGRMSKPECDTIKGLPPAIAIEQKTIARNPRSTVGTSTEIYEYLRLLFARIGQTYSPISGQEVKKHSTEDILACTRQFQSGTKFVMMAPLVIPENRSLQKQLEMELQQGYARIYYKGAFQRIEDFLEDEALLGEADRERLNTGEHVIWLLISRMSVEDTPDSISRLLDSAETAFYEGDGECRLMFLPSNIAYDFSTRFEADGIRFEEPSDNMFSFNSPLGACPTCEGFGRIIGIDEKLVIPNSTLSVYEGCYKIQYRVMMSRYRGKTVCPDCHGTRLKKEAEYVKINGMSITNLVEMPIANLKEWFDRLQLSEHDAEVGKRLLTEIRSRLQFLVDVGLGYLTLNRQSNTLSGGESQRINLTTSLGSSLVGSLYILDEPSIGLHTRDSYRLIHVLKELQSLGNTVIVVEHDEDIMRAADYLIDIGPDAGRLGGEIVFQGNVADILKDPEAPATQALLAKYPKSYSIKYLTGTETIDVPQSRRTWNRSILLRGCRMNNLKGINAEFPLNVMNVITGVSGSGKSSLVKGILYPALKRHLDEVAELPGEYIALEGDWKEIRHVEMVDQNPIGKSTRSNPATYVKAYDAIRQLYAEQPLAKQMGFSAQYFSFNADGGRCEECQGAGVITVEMQFMADLTLTCEACHGQRFKREILDVRFHGKNICEILEMTVSEAIEFFGEHQQKIIVDRLKPLEDVGLGYIKLGQNSSTLSGGENQRVKLAYFIGKEQQEPTLFIFDEPTTGLHFHDIKRLLAAFDALISRGHSIIVIEHNMDVIKCADHIIDLGPEGGDKGGTIVCQGTPETIAACKQSLTGKYLAEKLKP